ncbi:MAG: hypothetical protein ABSC94_07285 [Polyangiaceae bacterium]|jgi:hypothetical protein
MVAIVPAIIAGCVLTARAVTAQPQSPPYGRIDGDISLVAAVGGVLSPGGPRMEAEVRARYLDTVGTYATYEDGALLDTGAAPRRVLAGGLELRPLFLGRWLQGLEKAGPRLDLLVDSLGLELGATLAQPKSAPFASRAGFEVALGVEFPLFATATGPFVGVRGGLRWSEDALVGSAVRDAGDRAAYLAVTIAWHQLFTAHVIDLNDEAPR